ncbi:MAG: hypothetical protein JRH06_07115 [Deltaproteobacteria bacterium]|nr:hypothetical protein [Deltaproteobacteria bacterium]MBW2137312.1 hypothetical protein [Deltaproteobacteria bacterium]
MPEQEHGPLGLQSGDSLEGTEGKISGSSLESGGAEARHDNPLRDLKAEVLSIDWEITDRVMTRFIGEVERLRAIYHADKVFMSFLQILHSLGKYVRNKKGRAHPDAIKLLNSVYNSLEKVFALEGAPEGERKKILFAEVDRFRKLKAEIASTKGKPLAPSISRDGSLRESTGQLERQKGPEAAKAEKDTALAPQEELPHQGMQSNQLFLAALEEIKDYITGELNALRAELRQWREEFSKAHAKEA